MKDEPAERLKKMYDSKDLQLTISNPKKTDNDGIAKLYYDKDVYGKKYVYIDVTKKVMNSKYVCWRMSILLHELGHCLQFMDDKVTPKKPVPAHEIHGDAWENELKKSVCRGKLKVFSFLERSPKAKCLFQRNCLWCSTKESRMSIDVKKLNQIPEESEFGGSCLKCETHPVRLVPHIKKSETCLIRYIEKFGHDWQNIVQPKHAMLQRRKKRPCSSESICRYCKSSSDKNLPKHLAYNEECRNRYMIKFKATNVINLMILLKRERKRKNKQESRARKIQK